VKRAIVIIGIIGIIISGMIFIPKYLNEGDKRVKFKVLKSDEVPQKLEDILPKYLVQEKALSCKIGDEVYVVVTRGEKMSGGYSVFIDRIEKITDRKGTSELIVYAKYVDPKPDEMVTQCITYPFIVVKTNMDDIPDSIKLEVERE
jgi:hypothetical protein